MDLTGLITQDTIALPVLKGAHATLNAASSMGQLLIFESTVAPVAADLAAAMKTRRVARSLQKALPILSEASALIAGIELAKAVDAALEGMRTTTTTTFDGTAAAHAVLVMTALDRTRLACAVMLDLCESVGYAPNGKALGTPQKPIDTDMAGGIPNIFESSL